VEVNGTIFVQILIFLSLLLCLSRLMFAPMMRLFEERERRIEGARDDASRLNRTAQEKARDFEEKYKSASESARHVLAEQKIRIQKDHEDSIKALRDLASDQIKKAHAVIVQEEAHARKELLSHSDLLADEIVMALAKRH
jgi:F-type H+-transporting ATPase subunit b